MSSSNNIHIAFALVTFVACTNGGTGDDEVAVDASADSATSQLTCSGMLICLMGCTGPDAGACQASCVGRGTADAQTYFQALSVCTYTQCMMPVGGTAACSSATDTSAGCVACAALAGQGAACVTPATDCLAH